MKANVDSDSMRLAYIQGMLHLQHTVNRVLESEGATAEGFDDASATKVRCVMLSAVMEAIDAAVEKRNLRVLEERVAEEKDEEEP